MTDSRDLIDRWIEDDPHRPGSDEARLRQYGVHVWALIGYLKAMDGDVAAVAADYDVPKEAVEAAIAYYQQHTCAIDARLAANAA